MRTFLSNIYDLKKKIIEETIIEESERSSFYNSIVANIKTLPDDISNFIKLFNSYNNSIHYD